MTTHPMTNREVFLVDPSSRKLANQGVASVNDDRSAERLAVLRYELETFVCSGQYEAGIRHILETFLKNIDQSEQPGVWVSGFFGSGKSHLVKMLRAFWVNEQFPDHATARGLKRLPASITDLLKELDTRSRQHGGLQAASGTLGASASGSARLALLGVVFKSAGLPEKYHVAQCIMRLRDTGVLSKVQQLVAAAGADWNEELDNFHVSEVLYSALCEVQPQVYSAASVVSEVLPAIYPQVSDVSNTEMTDAIHQALARNGKFPLTMLILDEVQQYIGGDGRRSLEIQELVETCCKKFRGKLMFIGSGQTAITGTDNLKKLEGRFTVRVELKDSDVESVVREVILAKKPEAQAAISNLMTANLGEISKQLANSGIAHRQQDVAFFPADYPILPVRRRFWEKALRVLDPTGTESQLRNQLTLTHKAVQTVLDQPLGTVVDTDYLYFDAADRLLQTRYLPREVHERIARWNSGTADDKLMARACGLVFLINKLAAADATLAIRATVDTLADLLSPDLNAGSGRVLAELQRLLDLKDPGGRPRYDLLIKVRDEYRIQSRESAEWNDDYLSHRSALASESWRLDAERSARLRAVLAEQLKRVSFVQGKSKVPRTVTPCFDSALPSDSERRLYLWIRDGWNCDETMVRTDALQAGAASPSVFVFLPSVRVKDELRGNLLELMAAKATLDKRAHLTGDDGHEGREAMATIANAAEQAVGNLLRECLDGARVFQGGGQELEGNTLADKLSQAVANSLVRLYPQFDLADDPRWPKVLEAARKGQADALKAINYEAEPAKNPVCKAVLGFIGAAKKGAEISAHFLAAPYGWPEDALDAALMVLLVPGVLRATDDRNQLQDPRKIERRALGKLVFRLESVVLTPAQRLRVQQVFADAGLHAKKDEEAAASDKYLDALLALAESAGGAGPCPEKPNTSLLRDLKSLSGNERLLAIFNNADLLQQHHSDWKATAERIARRLPSWQQLQHLLAHAAGLPDADTIARQAEGLRSRRLLLTDPDPVSPLLTQVAGLLRTRLNEVAASLQERFAKGTARLDADPNWQKLSDDRRQALLAGSMLAGGPPSDLDLASPEAILATLEKAKLATLEDRVAALPGRFEDAALAAAQELVPKARKAQLPRRTLSSSEDLAAWLLDAEDTLRQQLKDGPVIL